jgi:FtsP/CotA-like multicopper oxidase with cupredoxin domain
MPDNHGHGVHHHEHQTAANGHQTPTGHGSHVATHEPPANMIENYLVAYQAAQPAPGRRVVSIDMDAREFTWDPGTGVPIVGWGFNGQVPGPTIEARVGDVLEIHFTNRLPEPTTIHWHGLRLPAAMDGTDTVQWPILPGESFTYRFRLLDAGTFWYHPHMNEPVQMERGMYGAVIVRGEDEPVFDEERLFILDDLKTDSDGDLAEFGGLVQWHDGREGDVRLMSGEREPEFEIAAGQVERWRIINASSARYIRFSIGGDEFRIIGTDGGLIEAPVTATEVLLPPADRVEIAVGPFEEGQRLDLDALKYWRSTIKRRKTERFGTVHVGPAKPSVAVLPDRLRTIAPLADTSAVPTRVVDFGIKFSWSRGLDFVINKEMHHHDHDVRVGELQVWDVVNSTLMDHPFHLHGFFFQVISVDGKPPAWRSWEDVVNLPPKSTTRIAWVADDRTGRWMYHCHILEHHAAGMMAHFDVVA